MNNYIVLATSTVGVRKNLLAVLECNYHTIKSWVENRTFGEEFYLCFIPLTDLAQEEIIPGENVDEYKSLIMHNTKALATFADELDEMLEELNIKPIEVKKKEEVA